MDELVQKAIQQAAALKKPSESISWKTDEPWTQSYYLWDLESKVWQPINWNIDFILPFAEARMSAALFHLEELANQLASTTAVVINLQECNFSDLINIGQKQWVRERFFGTDLDSSAGATGLYGTTMLVDRRLETASCFRVHYSATQMDRDALFVDVTVPESSKKIRLGNTHLESLAVDPPLRPSQMRLAAMYLHADEELAGAIIAGDFNAIQPFDSSLHSDNNLKDAYLELGDREDGEDGFTWGQQAMPALRDRFGCSRMDKAYFCGGGIKLRAFERFGTDIEVSEGRKRQKDGLLALGFEKAWRTDHLGIKATFSITNDTRL